MSNITKRALEDSLKHLLLKKPVNKITINDITEDCGVNRATFYYHFQDIYALIEWSCEEDSRKALSNNTTYDTWQQGFLNILHAVEDNKPFIVNVYRHVSQEQILQYRYCSRPSQNALRSIPLSGHNDDSLFLCLSRNADIP